MAFEQVPEQPVSPLTPTRNIGRSISQSLNRSLSTLRLRPLTYYTLPDVELSSQSLHFRSHFDADYADSAEEESEYSEEEADDDNDDEGAEVEREEEEEEGNVEDFAYANRFPVIPEDDEYNENWMAPSLARPPTSHLQWRTVPARKPVPLKRSHTSLRHSRSNLSRNRTVRSIRSPAKPTDPNLVTWAGDNDPANPLNWVLRKKWTSTLLVSSFTFISPLASTMVAPALDTIADDLNIETDISKVLVMSIFLLAYAVGPFVLAPLSEVFGRVVVLQCANLWFLLFNFACGFAKTSSQMMAFRFLSGLGGSAPQAIGGGVLSDLFPAESRGSALAVYSLAPFLGPVVGAIAGGYITQYSNWRWIFHSTSIADLVVQAMAVLFLQETYHPAILAKKCTKLKKETGNERLYTKHQADKTVAKLLQKAMIRPFRMLLTQPALQAMALYRAYGYGIMYLMFSTFPQIFREQYDMSVGTASLNYISLGVGFVSGLQISGPSQDKLYTYLKTHAVDPSASLRHLWYTLRRGRIGENDTESAALTHPKLVRRPTAFDPASGVPEHRLPLCLPFGLLIPLGLLIYGLSAAAHTHWFVPNMGAAICCLGLIITFNCAQAYVVDTYTNHKTGTNYAASATGAAAFVRTMAGFSFPLFAPRLYESLGVGGGNGVLAAMALVVGVVAPVGLWRWGGWLRSRSTYCTS